MKLKPLAVLFWFRKSDKTESTGVIVLRLTRGKSQLNISTGIKIEKKKWNPDRQTIRGNKRDTDYLSTLSSEVKRIAILKPSLTLEQYRNELFGEREPTTIKGLFDNYLSYLRKRVGIDLDASTYKINQRIFNIWKKHWARERVSAPTEINPTMIESFFVEGRKTGWTENYMVKLLAVLKQCLNYGFASGLIDRNPISHVRKAYAFSDPVHLEKAELEVIEKAILPERVGKVRDAFLLLCYTGLSFSDYVAFAKGECVVERYDGQIFISGNRFKTGKDFNVPVLPNVERILQKYEPGKFPLFCNADFNRTLKLLGAMLGITKNLRTKLGRSTCAQNMMDTGFSLPGIMAVLGHTNPHTTLKHYTRPGKARVIDDLQKLA